jgi:hypothetical protein
MPASPIARLTNQDVEQAKKTSSDKHDWARRAKGERRVEKKLVLAQAISSISCDF